MGPHHACAIHRHDRKQAQADRVRESAASRGRQSRSIRAHSFPRRTRYWRNYAAGDRGVRGGGDDRPAPQRGSLDPIFGLSAQAPTDDMTSVPAAAPRRIAGLVLAAGESSRMGRDKALLTYRGHTFLETIVSKLREASLDRIAVVLGHNAEAIERAVNLSGVEIAINHQYRRGQTLSLQVGFNALQDDGQVLDAIILCLVDHPAFEPATVARLISDFGRSPVRSE